MRMNYGHSRLKKRAEGPSTRAYADTDLLIPGDAAMSTFLINCNYDPWNSTEQSSINLEPSPKRWLLGARPTGQVNPARTATTHPGGPVRGPALSAQGNATHHHALLNCGRSAWSKTRIYTLGHGRGIVIGISGKRLKIRSGGLRSSAKIGSGSDP